MYKKVPQLSLIIPVPSKYVNYAESPKSIKVTLTSSPN